MTTTARIIRTVPALGLVAMPASYDAARITADDLAHDAAVCPARAELAPLHAATRAAWGLCVDTAGVDGCETRVALAEAAREAAEDLWTEALDAIVCGDVGAAREALEGARGLAADWGDDTEERRALALLGEVAS